jgi:hypothetical protein
VRLPVRIRDLQSEAPSPLVHTTATTMEDDAPHTGESMQLLLARCIQWLTLLLCIFFL